MLIMILRNKFDTPLIGVLESSTDERIAPSRPPPRIMTRLGATKQEASVISRILPIHGVAAAIAGGYLYARAIGGSQEISAVIGAICGTLVLIHCVTDVGEQRRRGD